MKSHGCALRVQVDPAWTRVHDLIGGPGGVTARRPLGSLFSAADADAATFPALFPVDTALDALGAPAARLSLGVLRADANERRVVARALELLAESDPQRERRRGS